MKWEPLRPRRILALDPGHRGIGFAVFDDDPFQLVDFGTKSSQANLAARLEKALKLVHYHEPDIVVFEDWRMAGVMRRESLKPFSVAFEELLIDRDAQYCTYSARRVRQLFLPLGARTKAEIARLLAARFPELAWRVPPIRKVWLPEDRQMGVFDALALGLAYFDESDHRSSATGP